VLAAYHSTETETAEAQQLEQLNTTLDRHVVDLAPESEGQAALLKGLGSPVIGIERAESNRPVPQLQIDRLALQPGTLVAVVGPNGAGKSTLFDAIMERDADLKIDNTDGAVVIGQPVHRRDRLRVARLDQEELLGGVSDVTAGSVLDHTAQHFKDQLSIDDKAWADPQGYERNLANQEAHL
jgi:ATPase subunit of ABC transporter with duplicated ATPase domains